MKQRFSFHKPSPFQLWGPKSIKWNYPPTIEQESITVMKHEAHTKRIKSRKRGEQREVEIQVTRHQTHNNNKNNATDGTGIEQK